MVTQIGTTKQDGAVDFYVLFVLLLVKGGGRGSGWVVETEDHITVHFSGSSPLPRRDERRRELLRPNPPSFSFVSY